MLDVFFLSNNESYADENYQKLLARHPLAKRVNGVKGFYAAHRCCAERSMTNNFYVVDADALLEDSFDFTFRPSDHLEVWGLKESELMYVWSSRNPINDLVYGYGGVKLIPKVPLVKSVDQGQIDFTTGTGIKVFVKEEISNITAFNYDEFSTWRAAFRECTKLATNITNESLTEETTLTQEEIDSILKETSKRLDIWTSVGKDRDFGSYAIDGANYGRTYGKENANNKEALAFINDVEWVKNEFNKFYK